MENRYHPRIPVKNFSADASDGDGFFQGMVENISRFGICFKNLPQRINSKSKKIVVVISGNGFNFKMSVRPRWSTLDQQQKSLGAEIINPPWSWTEFVMALEPKNDDVWASVTI
jgi:hypothetical protein